MLAAAEDGLLAGLRARGSIATRVRTVDSMPKLPVEQLLSRYAADAPALYVVPGTFVVRDDAVVMRFTIAGVIRNAAGHAAGRKGDGIDIGCDQLMLWAARAVHGAQLGGTTWQLTGGEMVDDDLFDMHGLSAVELTFEGAPVLIGADDDDAGLDDFLRLHADIDIPAHAGTVEHAKWLEEPPDTAASRPDLQADLSLPGGSA